MLVRVGRQVASLSEHEEQLWHVTEVLGSPIIPLLPVSGSHTIEQDLVPCVIVKQEGAIFGVGEFGYHGDTRLNHVRQACAIRSELEEGPFDEFLFRVGMPPSENLWNRAAVFGIINWPSGDGVA